MQPYGPYAFQDPSGAVYYPAPMHFTPMSGYFFCALLTPLLDGGFWNQATGQAYYPSPEAQASDEEDEDSKDEQSTHLSPQAQEFVPHSIEFIPLHAPPVRE
jgi:hypothetical protein